MPKELLKSSRRTVGEILVDFEFDDTRSLGRVACSAWLSVKKTWLRVQLYIPGDVRKDQEERRMSKDSSLREKVPKLHHHTS